MGKKTKIWLIIAVSLIVIGSVVFGGTMSMVKWDFTKLSTFEYENKRYEIADTYNGITIETNTADIVLETSGNSETQVLCSEQNNLKHSVVVEDGVLLIKVNDTRKWYEYIGINIGTPQITVCLPRGDYGELSIKSNTGKVEIPSDFKFQSIEITGSTGDVVNYASASESVKIKLSTGSIRTEGISSQKLTLAVSTGHVVVADSSCEDVEINVSTGKVNLTNINCNNLVSYGSAGDINLANTIASGKISVERDTGDVAFDMCDAGEISVQTSTGNVQGSFLTEKVFIAHTDTGKVVVPETTTGGKCEIRTDTGDIKITIKQ